MYSTRLFLITLSLFKLPLHTHASDEPGYYTNISTLAHNTTFTFGAHYAVLNLDLVDFIISLVANHTSGQLFINSVATWIDAVHAQKPPPLSIFTRVYLSNSHYPEIEPGSALSLFLGTGNDPATALVANNTLTQIWPAFKVLAGYDVVLQKTRYSATFATSLDLILRSQKIDTVILSGIRTSGVVLATATSLFSMNYNVYVISNNTIETAPDPGSLIDRVSKEGVIAKLPGQVITLEQALEALNRSGPAIYCR